MKRYRIKQWDVVNDVHILQRRFFIFLWISIGAGSTKELTEKIEQLEQDDLLLKD